MKQILLLATIIFYATFVASAQHDRSSHEQESKKSTTGRSLNGTPGDMPKQLSTIFISYTNLKNALVASYAASAALNANQLLRSINTIDFKLISEGNIHILAKDAGNISSTKDLKKQRQYFSNLSSNMVAVAKSFKLSETPIFVQYCPMKKASWLSSEKEIKNPYYGSTMLACGEVTETL